jgi:putative salt-induced outer membrane protein YdiY
MPSKETYALGLQLNHPASNRSSKGQFMSNRVTFVTRVICLICFLFLSVIRAQAEDSAYLSTEPATTDQSEVQKKAEAWNNFVPPSDSYDWVQLTSNEWLKGDIKVMYNEVLEFDSDELGILSLDMEDISQIRSGGIMSIRLNGPRVVYGSLLLTQDEIILTYGANKQTYKRSELVSISKRETREISLWSVKLNLGFDISSGNTDQTDYSSQLDLRRRTANNRFVATYLGQYSKTQDIDTADNNRLNSFIDIFQTRRFYWRPIFAEYFRDPFQNIQSQYTLGAGLGYQLVDTKKTEWNLTTGPAYQKTRFDSVVAGEDKEASTPALVTSTTYETELTKRIDFDFTYSFKLVNESSGTYTHHTVTSFETELTSWLDFDIAFIWDYVKDPTPNSDGTIPDSDDYKLTLSLGIEY